MLDVPVLALPVAVAAGGLAAAWWILERTYTAVPPNKALVLFGRRSALAARRGDGPGSAASPEREPRILIGGGAYLAPWNRSNAYLSLAPIDVETTVRALRALEGVAAEGWEIGLQVQAKVPAEPRALRAAAENLLGLGDDELRAYVRRTVEGVVPTVLARLRSRDGEPDWERVASEIQAAVAPELVTAGLLVRSVCVRELHRIAPSARPERPVEGRRRAGWAPNGPSVPAGRDDSELRLGRVERGLREIAADLARLLRDEPARTSVAEEWPTDPPADRTDGTTHDSIADGRAPGITRPPWGAASDPEANPDSIG